MIGLRLRPLPFLLCLVLSAGPTADAATVPPGYTDVFVADVPTMVSNHFGDIVEDAVGNLYCTGGWASTVFKCPPMGVFTIYATVPGAHAVGLTIDGNTLYAGNDNGGIYSFDLGVPAPPPAVLVASTTPGADVNNLVVGCAGYDMLAATQSGMYGVDRVAGTSNLLTAAFGQIPAVTCHPSGTSFLFTAHGASQLQEFTPPSTSALWLSTASGPDCLAFHGGTGLLYVGTSGSNEIYEIDPAGPTATLFASAVTLDGGWLPSPLAFSRDGTRLYYGTVSAGSYVIRAIEGFPGLAGGRVRTIDATPAVVHQGSTGHVVTVEVENTAQNAVDVTTVTLRFVGTADRTAEYVVTPDPGNPISLAPMSTVSFDFTVDVDAAATLELVTLDAAFVGVDTVTMVPSTDPGADTTDDWDVRAGSDPQIRSVDAAAAIVVQGGGAYPVSVTVENLGINDIQIGSADLTFTGTADRTAEYVVTPDPANPAILGAGVTGVLQFLVDVDPLATEELITLDATFAGVDVVTLAAVMDVDADMTDTWLVMACGATLCGDCNGDGMITILDALTAAQHSAGLLVLTGSQFTNCNVIGLVEPDPGATVSIVDALTIAQFAAGLPVALVCC